MAKQIKQIQLRGISRSPSDRMNSDGGVAESLNMQLNGQESSPVPSIRPLPYMTNGDFLLIHKTGERKNYIANEEGIIKYYSEQGNGEIVTLPTGETIADAIAVGNTIIISTDKNMHYARYRNGQYYYLGTEVPMPKISFYAKEEKGDTYPSTPPKTIWNTRANAEVFPSKDTPWGSYEYNVVTNSDERPDFTEINQDYDSEMTRPMRSENSEVMRKVSEWIALQDDDNAKNGIFSYPVWVSYAVRLYDDNKIVSLPVLLQGHSVYPYNIHYAWGYYLGSETGSNVHHTNTKFTIERKHAYKIYYSVDNMPENIDLWSDIILSIDIFTSLQVGEGLSGSLIGKFESEFYGTVTTSKRPVSYGVLRFGEKSYNFEEEAIAQLQTFFMQKSEDIDFYKSLPQNTPQYLNCLGGIKATDMVSSRDKITDGGNDYQRYKYHYNNLLSMNGRVLGSDASREIIFRNNDMNAVSYWNNDIIADRHIQKPILYHVSEAVGIGYSTTVTDAAPYQPRESTYSGEYRFDLQYQVDIIGESLFIHDQGRSQDVMGRGVQIGSEFYYATAYPIILCQERRATNAKMGVIRDHGLVANDIFTLKRGNIPFNYWIGDMDVPLSNIFYEIKSRREDTENTEPLPEKMFLSAANNPFYFPLEGVTTMTSDILGVAATSTPLSEGQFGQFSLYVFTSSGIYALQSDDEGSLRSPSYVSGDVIENNRSILPIEQQVVFITSQGVMSINGREVTCISPNMIGSYYVLEGEAKTKILRSAFRSLAESIGDEVTFMEYMKSSKMAFDYNGRRLLFFREDRPYAYIYMMRTSTWHKITLPQGHSFCNALNSYPEAQVVLKGRVGYTIHCIRAISDIPSSVDEFINEFYTDGWTLDECGLTRGDVEAFLRGNMDINLRDDDLGRDFISDMRHFAEIAVTDLYESRVHDYSTMLDEDDRTTETTGVIITRALDFGFPDILKSISHIKIRGKYELFDPNHKPRVSYLLLGSQDGIHYHLLNSLRGKSWKMFRMMVFTNLRPDERVSWIDVEFEPRRMNKLR